MEIDELQPQRRSLTSAVHLWSTSATFTPTPQVYIGPFTATMVVYDHCIYLSSISCLYTPQIIWSRMMSRSLSWGYQPQLARVQSPGPDSGTLP